MINEKNHKLMIQEKLNQLRSYDGQTIQELQNLLRIKIPESRIHTKGKIGTLIEKLLGCEAGSRSVPDFEELGLELKIIPVNESGKPWETTAITSINFFNMLSWKWEDSRAYHKTRHILFAPIIKRTEKTLIQDRILKNPFIWSPNLKQDLQLKEDWELVANLIKEGKADTLSGRMGVYMQPRPKGRNSRDMVDAPGSDGNTIRVMRRAFYFLVKFTEPIIKAVFLNQSQN